jgi:hypothetical protein
LSNHHARDSASLSYPPYAEIYRLQRQKFFVIEKGMGSWMSLGGMSAQAGLDRRCLSVGVCSGASGVLLGFRSAGRLFRSDLVTVTPMDAL